MASKLDINKAYDQIEWNFLFDVMAKIGFSDKWISFISRCVLTGKFNVMMNGDSIDFISLNRGLRQSDPISPYLFLLVQNALSLLINAMVRCKVVRASKVRRLVLFYHIYSLQTTLIFSEATVKKAANYLDILQGYEAVSGQFINFEKSEIFFSPNVNSIARACFVNF